MTRKPIDLTQPLNGVGYQRRDDGIAIITLDRPDRGNALAPHMQPIVRAIWDEVRDDDTIRVAIITAAVEPHVCPGVVAADGCSVGAATVFHTRTPAQSGA